MKHIILSDIHGNLEALNSVLKAAEKEGEIKYCLGDTVGYGANPSECLAAVQHLEPSTVKGNHEAAVIHPGLTAVFNPQARQAVFWTREHLNQEELTKIDLYPLKQVYGEVVLVHSNLIEPEKWYYIFSQEDMEANFRFLEEGQVCFFGHSHIPGIYCWKNRKLSSLPLDGLVKIEPEAKYLINVGAVGQPRDRDARAAYCVFDPEDKTVAIRRVEYDIHTAQKKIIEAGLPTSLASRLSLGR